MEIKNQIAFSAAIISAGSLCHCHRRGQFFSRRQLSKFYQLRGPRKKMWASDIIKWQKPRLAQC